MKSHPYKTRLNTFQLGLCSRSMCPLPPPPFFTVLCIWLALSKRLFPRPLYSFLDCMRFPRAGKNVYISYKIGRGTYPSVSSIEPRLPNKGLSCSMTTLVTLFLMDASAAFSNNPLTRGAYWRSQEHPPKNGYSWPYHWKTFCLAKFLAFPGLQILSPWTVSGQSSGPRFSLTVLISHEPQLRLSELGYLRIWLTSCKGWNSICWKD